MKKHFLLVAILFVMVSFSLAAQSATPSALLQYFDDPSQITITDSSGNPVDPYYGLDLALGDTVKTQNSTAEIQLDPNGSIIKLAYNTTFTVQTLQGRNNQNSNDFNLLAGTVRTIAARNTQGGYNYSIQTPTAVCGVRGTDFTLDVVPGKTDAVGVLNGEVNFVNTSTGQSINIAAGMYANTFAAAFQAVKMTQEQVSQLFSKMNFEKLVPTSVPGHADETPTPTTAQTTPPPSPPPAQPTGEASSQPKKPGPLDPFFNYLRDNLGMEIGTITIDGTTYSKAVLQPQINAGKLHMQLYLPVIYTNDLFNYNDWYKPAGNNEWSFGTDQTTTQAKIEDFASDLFLKIKYFEWGAQRDPFYIKLGNLEDMTIGHGLLMSNYANDEDFPAIRKVGLNMGLDLGRFGFETVVNNLANPQIFGGRLYVRPFGKGWLHPAFGVSSIADMSPAADLADPTLVGNPIFITLGTDIDLPVIETGPFAIIAFADLGGMVPNFRNSFTSPVNGTPIAAGLDTSVLTYTDPTTGTQKFRNYGFESGLFGNIFIVNWRLAYRNYDGVFQPNFFNSTYNRTRSLIAQQMADYVGNPNATQYQMTTSGIYGQAGMDIGKVVSFEAGYLWPWSPNGQPAGSDFLHLRLDLKRGIIPNFGISASLSYDRTDFIDTLLGTAPAGYNLFDANTTMSAQVVYPVAPTLDIAALVSFAAKHDQYGNLIMDPATNYLLPEIAPSVSIETRVHF